MWKISKEIITFAVTVDIEIEKRRFHYHTNPILRDKILMSNKVSFIKDISILLVTKMMIIKLIHCI